MRRFDEIKDRPTAGSARWRPGAYAVLVRGGAVLLTHQAGPVPEWQLPGGGIDAGEGPLAAMHREVLEETGWRIAAPRFLSAHRRRCVLPETGEVIEKMCSLWLAWPVIWLRPQTEPHHSAAWMPLASAARALADPGAGAAIRRLSSCAAAPARAIWAQARGCRATGGGHAQGSGKCIV